MRYTNKFVEFLNNSNTIKISGVKDFNSFNSLCKKIGLDMLKQSYWDLLHIAQINHCAINNTTILVEYQPFKGFSIGYRTIEDSAKWYGMQPYTMKEIMQSIKGEK